MVEIDAAGDSFKQVLHGSSLLPDLVIAQVQLDTGYISEGQGTYCYVIKNVMYYKKKLYN